MQRILRKSGLKCAFPSSLDSLTISVHLNAARSPEAITGGVVHRDFEVALQKPDACRILEAHFNKRKMFQDMFHDMFVHQSVPK